MTINTGSGQHQAVINVTPMIDVLLVLLIIFMAIAPDRQAGLDAAVPQTHRIGRVWLRKTRLYSRSPPTDLTA